MGISDVWLASSLKSGSEMNNITEALGLKLGLGGFSRY